MLKSRTLLFQESPSMSHLKSGCNLFPPDLNSVPQELRIAEVFGWTRALYTAGLVLFSSIVFTQPARPTRSEYLGALIAVLASILLLALQIRRRRNPRVLAPLLALIAIAAALAIFLLPGWIAIPRAERIDAMLASLIFLGFAGSLAWTRFYCDHCSLPRKGWRGNERILVKRKDLPLLLSRPGSRSTEAVSQNKHTFGTDGAPHRL